MSQVAEMINSTSYRPKWLILFFEIFEILISKRWIDILYNFINYLYLLWS